jgi:hypothetical protein
VEATLHVRAIKDAVPGVTRFQAFSRDGQRVPGPTVAIVAITHGNETVGERVVSGLRSRLLENLKAGEVVLVRSNLRAFEQNARHTVGGVDLNRLWDADTLNRLRMMSVDERCYEQQRVLDLAPLLQEVDAILDLHSTSQPSPPFLVCRDDRAHARVASKLGVTRVVTGLHEDGVLGGGMCPDVGLSLGQRSERVGFTYEAGTHLDPGNRARAFDVAERFIGAFDLWRDPMPHAAEAPIVYDVIGRFRQAQPRAEPFRFVGYDEEGGSFSGATGRPLASFTEVEAGEVILARGAHTVVRAPSRFKILLPTPTADPGTDLYYMAIERRTDLPGLAWERTHEHARLEAEAIERTLDLLADDRFAAGVTWASFHRRQTLDLAAQLVARTLRLPEGHPHRRLTIVGRGDWGGGSSELRAGRRYRQAIRMAMVSGVPIDRFQLLRGATFGWLQALTSERMAQALAARARMRGDAGGIGLYLSTSRPSTIAMLVVGDPELALRMGDLRHVRVGIVIEAPTVEPDGDRARVRISRIGLFSARRAFLRTADTLLTAMRTEHNTLMARAPLANDPMIQRHLGAKGQIQPPPDLSDLAGLGESIRALQHGLWKDALRHEIEPTNLATGEEVGNWLEHTMTRTGVLDADAVRHLLVVRRGESWAVDPQRLETELPPTTARSGVVRHPMIRPPIVAADVDADNLDRWVGWKRFLAQCQVIPDTRGEDVDIALDERAIQERITRWFDEARRLAARSHVMVVIAGNGLRPGVGPDHMQALTEAHQQLLADGSVRYMRIQHMPGSYLRWLKGLVRDLRTRGPSSRPASLHFEGGHGASVNVVLVAMYDGGEPPAQWSLDGWRVERCGVLISSAGSEAARIGVFAEPLPGPERRLNLELLHFGRAHCQGLLLHSRRPESLADADSSQQQIIKQLQSWIERARDQEIVQSDQPMSLRETERWLGERLGLSDRELVQALVRQMHSNELSTEAAERLWRDTPPWPPPLEDQCSIA